MRGLRVPITTSRTLNRNPRSASKSELFPSDCPPTATISGIDIVSLNATAAACSRLYASNPDFDYAWLCRLFTFDDGVEVSEGGVSESATVKNDIMETATVVWR
ncbi:hypothetical protein DEO72_LG3g1086 [Vigna unguiculata]|uniref:Uncharacterized protein n=1 Tax=Vigna unguiculata TaxID=3917 RepID=A0A4D6LD94_VIGUN|nr:hypothetical protein DEO72_LG3g1086 [Vigna unguiculata]